MDLHEYAEKFYESKRASGRAENTLISYRGQITRFLDWATQCQYTGSDLWGLAGAETIEAYATHQRGNELSPFSIHGTYRALRALYKWIELRFRPETENPFRYLAMPKLPDQLPSAISYQQTIILINRISSSRYCPVVWIAQRDRLIIKLLFETGLRACEFLSLRIGDVDLERRRIRVMRWKTGREDFIPFSKSLHAELQTWLADQRPVAGHDGLWPSYVREGKQAGGLLQYSGLREMLRRRCKHAKLPIFSPHDFRHGCGVYIILHGGDISLVAKILGHRQLSTTEVYLRFNTDQVASLYDRVFS